MKTLPPIPKPTHGNIEHGSLHTPESMQAYGQQCREAALLDAMNATLPFGKTGAVIAAAIGALK